MPAPFSPVHIPFVSGVRQDLGKLAQENPAQLRQARDVMFTKKGHIVGRPALQSRDSQVQLGQGTALVGSLASIVAGATPSGIVSAGFQGTAKADIDTPLACWQGQSYFNRGSLWEYAGVHWSLRQTKSATLETHNPPVSFSSDTQSIPVGQSVVGVLTTIGSSAGIPFLTSDGEVAYTGTAALTNFDSTDRNLTAAAGNAVFWHMLTPGTVFGFIPTGAGPTTTQITVGTGSSGGGLAATVDGAGNYYVVFGGGPGPGTANVVKISPAGAILQTLSLTFTAGAATNGLLDITYDAASNRLGVAAAPLAGTAVWTKIITLVAGVMADAGIDLTLTGTSIAGGTSVVAGTTHDGKMSVLFSLRATNWTTGAAVAKSGSVYIGGRSFTAATETAITILNGAINGSDVGLRWDCMFGGRAVGGRTLVGVFRGLDNVRRSSQWLVLDVTSLYASSNTTDRVVAASGPAYGAEFITPSSVYSTATQVAFGVSEGIVFSGAPDTSPSTGTGNVPVMKRAATRRITLSLQGVQGVHVNGTTLLSGQLLHVFDGAKVRPHHFSEETPYIFNGGAGFVYTSAGGTLAAGSYSYQATWEAVNGRGQTTRSGASPIITIPAVALNQQVTLHVTKPQLWNNPTAAEYVRVRLWATQTNPTNNAAKYLAAETTVTSPSTGFDVTLVHSAVAAGVEEPLYETVDTLADMRAPGADRGVAVVAERVWCADQTKLYVSKIIRPNLAVSWNTEDTNVLPLPSTLGTIQGLAAVNQGLVVLCSRGGAVVTGPGVDDTGAGPGWVLQIIDGVPGMGTSSPRSCTAIAAGVVFQAQDGDIWLANSSGQAVPTSRAVRDFSYTNPTNPVDLVNVTPTGSTNSMLISHSSAALRVLDLELGQWGTWSFPSVTPSTGLYLASINGAVWIQTTAPGVIYSADDFGSNNDAGLASVTSTIETGILRPSNPTPHGWGRIRAVTLNELRLFGDTTISINMQVIADQNERSMMNKTKTTGPTDPVAFPNGGDGVLEFRTSVQRCSYARVILSITPNRFDAEGLDLWVSNTGERTPSNNRS